jgi:predicted NUDIX family NTP pyrophosphohydrolase
MGETSAGLLMYHIDHGRIMVFLGHVGGPFGKKDKMWGVPKGEIDNGKAEKVDVKNEKEVLNNAMREFEEEIGFVPKMEGVFYLGSVRRTSGKLVYVWAFEGQGYEKFVKSNEIELEWPSNSGKIIKVPEIDDARYFSIEDAKKNIHKFQEPLIDMLVAKLKDRIGRAEKQGKLI